MFCWLNTNLAIGSINLRLSLKKIKASMPLKSIEDLKSID